MKNVDKIDGQSYNESVERVIFLKNKNKCK